MHPFLDVSKLTDEEIIEKLGKAYTHMNAQMQLGHNATVTSINEIIQDLEGERNNRLEKAMADEFKKKYPNQSAPIDLGKLED